MIDNEILNEILCTEWNEKERTVVGEGAYMMHTPPLPSTELLGLVLWYIVFRITSTAVQSLFCHAGRSVGCVSPDGCWMV